MANRFLLQHLPDYTTVQSSAVLRRSGGLKRPLAITRYSTLSKFAPVAEAVTAVYPRGPSCHNVYTNPQSSIEADTKVQQFMDRRSRALSIVRIGNYNAFVFGAELMPSRRVSCLIR
jgi:hypothetical protein